MIRYIALILFGLFLGGMSWIAWRLPFQMVAPELYASYLVPENGSVTATLGLLWFAIGGYKTALIMTWDRSEAFHMSLLYKTKAFFLVPFVSVVSWKSTWWKLPTTDYMQSKR